MQRLPACAGRFYQASPEDLRTQVQSLLPPRAARMTARALLSPHAALPYSGAVAGATYSRVELPPAAILIGPNHTGAGPPLSIYTEGEWLLPGGAVGIAAELARAFLAHCPAATPDHLAHLHEHSLEVQLPFLHLLRPDMQILPIVVGFQDLDSCLVLGQALATVMIKAPVPPLLIGSTDFTHCGPGFPQMPPAGLTAEAFARRQDQLALTALHTLDAGHFHHLVTTRQISMCGYAAATAVLAAVQALGARQVEISGYATSADVTGDVHRVVGYGGVVIA